MTSGLGASAPAEVPPKSGCEDEVVSRHSPRCGEPVGNYFITLYIIMSSDISHTAFALRYYGFGILTSMFKECSLAGNAPWLILPRPWPCPPPT